MHEIIVLWFVRGKHYKYFNINDGTVHGKTEWNFTFFIKPT